MHLMALLTDRFYIILAGFSMVEFAYWLVHLNLLFLAQTVSLQCLIVWLLIGDNEIGIQFPLLNGFHETLKKLFAAPGII